MSQETKLLIACGLVTVAIIVGGVLFYSSKNPAAGGQTTVDASLLIRDDSYKSASGSAAVPGSASVSATLVEFGDFECPACGVAHPIIKKIISDYSGKLVYVFRHYPLPQHKSAPIAAEAAEAAGEQGKFFEMQDKLYETQSDWSEKPNALDFFTGYAKDIGLNVEQFKKDVEANKFKEKINRDVADGDQVGIDATPTFFINGQKYSGSLTEDGFKTEIDKVLNNR